MKIELIEISDVILMKVENQFLTDYSGIQQHVDSVMKIDSDKDVHFDMSNVFCVDSMLLIVVINIFKKLKIQNRRLEIINPSKSVETVFELTNLWKVIDYKNESKIDIEEEGCCDIILKKFRNLK